MTILDAMRDPKLFLPWFKPGLLRGDSWKPWRSYLCALFGLPFEDEDAFEIFKRHTGRTVRPGGPFGEAFAICGRRAGKTLILALIVVYCAAFKDYSSVSVAGETLAAMLLASDRKQAAIALRYVEAFFDKVPMLRQMVIGRTVESISLSNGVTILVGTSDYRAVRGYTLVCCVCDEICFWPSGDVETLNAIRPALSTIPGSILLASSSPYAQTGLVWEVFREGYGKDDSPILVWRAKTRAMNSNVPRAVIAAAYLRDPASASAEYGAQFRTDVSSFIPQAIVQSRVVPGRLELPPNRDVSYYGFTDPSGGSSDAFTLAIAHAEAEVAVLDVLREIQPPFSPENVVSEFAATLKKYRCFEVTGDKYAGNFPRELFQKQGISYKVAEHTRSELYLEVLPGLMSDRVRLLDNKRLVSQLCGLERRVGRSGKDSVDHSPGSHDDLSNSAAGALVLALATSSGILGLIEFDKLEAAAKLPTPQIDWGKEFAARFQMKMVGIDPANAHPIWDLPQPAPCEACGASCVVRLNNFLRCNECGLQTWPNGISPTRETLTRGDVLRGKGLLRNFKLLPGRQMPTKGR